MSQDVKPSLGPIPQPGVVDAKDPRFAPDREVTPPLQGRDPDGLLEFVMDLVTPETAEEKANRYYREAEDAQLKRDRMAKIMDNLREKRKLRQDQDIAAQEDLPSGGADAFSLDRAVQDILREKNSAQFGPET